MSGAHNNLGRLLHSQNENAAARESFAEAVRLNPNYPTAHNNLGAVLQAMGRIDEAMAHFRKAISIRADYPEAHFNLGSALLSLGDPTAAIQRFRGSHSFAAEFHVRHHMLLGQGADEHRAGRGVRGTLSDGESAITPEIRHRICATGGCAGAFAPTRGSTGGFESGACGPSRTMRAVLPTGFACLSRLRSAIGGTAMRELRSGSGRMRKARRWKRGSPRQSRPFMLMSLPWSAQRQLEIARSHARSYEEAAGRQPSDRRQERVASGVF